MELERGWAGNAGDDAAGRARRSQPALAYEALRARILAGVYAPDEKLKVRDLAAEFSFSPGSVREALSRLVPEQLVVSREQRGFVVAPLSIDDLEELTDLRCAIEAIALRRSLERGDVNWEAGVLAAAHRLRGTTKRPPTVNAESDSEWQINHALFHAALVGACGSRRLLMLHRQLFEQSERYRSLSAPIKPDRDVDQEHHELVDYALARDADGLVKVIEQHFRCTTNLIIQSLEEMPQSLGGGGIRTRRAERRRSGEAHVIDVAG